MDDFRRAVIDTLARVHELQHDGPRSACAICKAGLAGWDAGQRAEAIPESRKLAVAPVAPFPASPVAVAPARRAAPTVPATPEQLHAALEAAPDDDARTRLLAAASRNLRAQYNLLLVYLAMAADDSSAPYTEFSRRLAAAADDAERAAIITATDKAFVAEWTWRQDATTDDCRRRYLKHCGLGDL